MKTLIIFSLTIFCLVNVNTADACSYSIDEAKKSVELQKVALASLGDYEVLSTSVSNFSFYESKPTQMCPEEITYNAVVTVSFKYRMNTCTFELAVKKVEAKGKSDLDTYTITGRKKFLCK